MSKTTDRLAQDGIPLIRAIRARYGISLLESSNIVWRQQAVEAIELAETLDDLKAVLRHMAGRVFPGPSTSGLQDAYAQAVADVRAAGMEVG